MSKERISEYYVDMDDAEEQICVDIEHPYGMPPGLALEKALGILADEYYKRYGEQYKQGVKA